MVARIPLHLAVADDGTVTFEVAIVAAGDGVDTTVPGGGGRAAPVPATSYVTVYTVPPGIAAQVRARIDAAAGT